MKIPLTREIVTATKLYPAKIKAIFGFGSRVYKTHNENSDWDFVVIANTPDTNREILCNNFNIHLMTQDQFFEHLKQHRSFAVECFYAPQEFKLYESVRFNWEIKRSSLAHSFKHISNSAWYDFQSRFEENYYSAIKCVFHSIRVPSFGIQILKDNKIDFESCNDLHNKLQSKVWTPEQIIEEFEPLRQSVLEDLRNRVNNFH